MDWRIILSLIGILLVLPSLPAGNELKDTDQLDLHIHFGNPRIDENTDIVLDCIDHKNPHTPIRWLRSDDQPLPPQSTFPLPAVGRLDIHNIQVKDSGIYICEASDYPLSTPGQRVNVTLEVRPLSSGNLANTGNKELKATDYLDLRIATRNLTVDENTDIFFDCIDIGNVHASIRWLRSDNQPLPPQSTFPLPTVGRLDIHNIQVEDSGIYICEASDYSLSTPGQRVNVTLEVRRSSSRNRAYTGDEDLRQITD